MERVLVVEDDDAVRQVIVVKLTAEGFAVEEASNGPDGLTLLRSGRFDAAVLDVTLPGLDGYGILRSRRLHGWAPATRVLMLTARTDDKSHLDAWTLGCDGYMTKPFDVCQLLDNVRQLAYGSMSDIARSRREAREKADLLDQVDALARMGASRVGPGTRVGAVDIDKDVERIAQLAIAAA